MPSEDTGYQLTSFCKKDIIVNINWVMKNGCRKILDDSLPLSQVSDYVVLIGESARRGPDLLAVTGMIPFANVFWFDVC